MNTNATVTLNASNTDAVTSVTPRKSINSLSNEILRIILEYVYIIAYADEEKDLDDDPATLKWTPYWVFLVSKKWHVVARTLPIFERNIMIYIDEPLSLVDTQEAILRTRPHKLKIFVVRRNYPSLSQPPPSEDDVQPMLVSSQVEEKPFQKAANDLESSNVKDLTPLLKKYMTRFQVLVFDLEYRSSLPCISNFWGSAAKLVTLRIQSRTIDKAKRLRPGTRHLRTAKLQWLDLDGQIFVRALNIQGWLESLQSLNQKELCLSNLFRDECKDFDLYELIRHLSLKTIGHLAKLQLTNISLDGARCHDFPPIAMLITEIEFHNMSYSVLASFFAITTYHIRPNLVAISNCDLEPPEPERTIYFSMNSFRLRLRNITNSGFCITSFVRNWDGFSLCFENCPNVDDSLFDTMCTIDATAVASDGFYMYSCRDISMMDFPNITAGAVKRLVVARKALAEKHREDGKPSEIFRTIHAMWFTGQGPPISEEDRKWFNEQNLNAFVWYSPPPPKIIIDGEDADFLLSLLIDDPVKQEQDDVLPFQPEPQVTVKVENQDAPMLSLPTTVIPVTHSHPAVLPAIVHTPGVPAPAPAFNQGTVARNINAPPKLNLQATVVVKVEEVLEQPNLRKGWESPILEDDYANLSFEDFEEIVRSMDGIS